MVGPTSRTGATKGNSCHCGNATGKPTREAGRLFCVEASSCHQLLQLQDMTCATGNIMHPVSPVRTFQETWQETDKDAMA